MVFLFSSIYCLLCVYHTFVLVLPSWRLNFITVCKHGVVYKTGAIVPQTLSEKGEATTTMRW